MDLHGIIFTYAVDDLESFEDIYNWVKKVKELNKRKNMVLMLLANKCDSPNRVITK